MLAVSSKRQTCVSHSTPEAEIVAADEVIRTECLPASLLWEAILRRCILIRFREDNETVCKIVAAGGSAKLAHMPRTHKVNAASVAEWCGKGGHVIRNMPEPTTKRRTLEPRGSLTP